METIKVEKYESIKVEKEYSFPTFDEFYWKFWDWYSWSELFFWGFIKNRFLYWYKIESEKLYIEKIESLRWWGSDNLRLHMAKVLGEHRFHSEITKEEFMEKVNYFLS